MIHISFFFGGGGGGVPFRLLYPSRKIIQCGNESFVIIIAHEKRENFNTN